MRKRNIILLIYLALCGHLLSGSPGRVIFSFEDQEGCYITATPINGSSSDFFLSANPAPGYEFIQWSDGILSSTRLYTYSGEMTLRAIFGLTEDIHVPHGDVHIRSIEGTSYQLLARNNVSCAYLVKWNDGQQDSLRSFVEGDGRLYPSFKIDPMRFSYRNGDENCAVTITPHSECGFTVTAIPQGAYKFVYWADDTTNTALQRQVDYVEETYTAIFARGVVLCEDTSFNSIQEAIENGFDTLHLLDDVTENVVIPSGREITIDAQGYSIGDLTIENGAKLILTSSLTANNLYLNTTTGSSSQFVGATYLHYSDAYIDIRLEPIKTTAIVDKWYAIGVPFNVQLNSENIIPQGATTPSFYRSDFLIWKYDSQLRAENNENGWVIMNENEMLTPGHFYMIGVTHGENVWRFHKSNNFSFGGFNSMPLHEYPSFNVCSSGWNAVANPALYYTDAILEHNDVQFVQIYDNNAPWGRYMTVPLSEASFVMASEFFVQINEDEQMVFPSYSPSHSLFTPQRILSNDVRYKISLTNNDEVSDWCYLTFSEDASNYYQIGRDVVKMFGGKENAYIWLNAFEHRLAAHETLLYTDVELELSVPQDDIYTISAQGCNLPLFLVQDGITIADISQSEYLVPLQKGTYQYTIRIQHSEDIVTNMNDKKNSKQYLKFIRNGQLYIHVANKIYNVLGERAE